MSDEYLHLWLMYCRPDRNKREPEITIQRGVFGVYSAL